MALLEPPNPQVWNDGGVSSYDVRGSYYPPALAHPHMKHVRAVQFSTVRRGLWLLWRAVRAACSPWQVLVAAAHARLEGGVLRAVALRHLLLGKQLVEAGAAR